MMVLSSAAAALVVAAAVSLSGNEVHASGFAAARFGGEHGNVTTDNPTALYYNPAAISYRGFRLFAEGTLALRNVTWQHTAAPTDPPEPDGAQGSVLGRGALSNTFGGPMLGATGGFGNLALGASLSVPFGGRAHWDKNERFRTNPTLPLAVDGVQRWHQIDGELTFIYFTVGAAYRLGRISVGVAGNLIRASVLSIQAKNPTGDGRPDLMREGRATLDVAGWLGSFGLGVLVEAIEGRLWLGASYQAQPGLGPMKLKGTLDQAYQGEAQPFPSEFHQALPDVVRAGLRFRPKPAAELRVSGDFTRWSVMQTQCLSLAGHECVVTASGDDATPEGAVLQNLRRFWNDTWAARAGLSVWPVPTVEVFAGGAVETAAVPDSTLEPSLADATNIAGALGVRLDVGNGLFLAASYTHVYYLERDNTGKSTLANASRPTARQDGGGKFTQWIGLFNLSIEKQF
jgi:long-chain fatty acid transport protein